MISGKEVLRQPLPRLNWNVIGTFWNVIQGWRVCKLLKAWCRGPGSHQACLGGFQHSLGGLDCFLHIRS